MKVLLQNIRSAHNVGSVFRTSDAVGVSEIFLGGYTMDPVDKYGNVNRSFKKVSLGAEEVIPYNRVSGSVSKFIEQKKEEGFVVVALELGERAIDYSKIKFDKADFDKILLILGNEKRGVSKIILDRCDYVLEIPMHGMKESLNVSVAFGIAAFAIRDFVLSRD